MFMSLPKAAPAHYVICFKAASRKFQVFLRREKGSKVTKSFSGPAYYKKVRTSQVPAPREPEY